MSGVGEPECDSGVSGWVGGAKGVRGGFGVCLLEELRAGCITWAFVFSSVLRAWIEGGLSLVGLWIWGVFLL